MGLCFNQMLQISGFLILIRMVCRQRLFQCHVIDHVTQHPPDIHRLAAIKLLDAGIDQGLIGPLILRMRRC